MPETLSMPAVKVFGPDERTLIATVNPVTRARTEIKPQRKKTDVDTDKEILTDILTDIRKDVKALDPTLTENDDVFKTAVLIFSALFVGTTVQRLAKFTGYPPAFINKRRINLLKQRIWRTRGRSIHRVGDDIFEQDPETKNWHANVVGFWLTVLVAEGMVEVVEGGGDEVLWKHIPP
jgi:hypothetical protein